VNNLRIVRLAGVHKRLSSEWFESRFPQFELMQYEDKLSCFLSQGIMYSDSFSFFMSQLGHEITEIVWDCEVLQKSWAEENGLELQTDDCILEIVLAQIRAIRPEVVYLQGTELCIPGRFVGERNEATFVSILKEQCPWIPLVAMFSGYPGDVRRVKEVDLLFACSPAIVRNYKFDGKDCFLCYHGFDDRLLQGRTVADGDKKYPLTFVGSTRAPEARYWLLRKMMERTTLQLWIDDSDERSAIANSSSSLEALAMNLHTMARNSILRVLSIFDTQTLRKLTKVNIGRKVRNLAELIIRERVVNGPDHIPKDLKRSNQMPKWVLRDRYPDRCFDMVIGLEYFNVIRKSVMTLNQHTDNCLGSAGNMRMFEATGIGACLLTDMTDNLGSMFRIGEEVLAYSTVKDAIDKANYFSKNPVECKEIAAGGQKRTLRDHTLSNRCQLIDEVLRSKF
jgi:spore maturation protein CgeB